MDAVKKIVSRLDVFSPVLSLHLPGDTYVGMWGRPIDWRTSNLKQEGDQQHNLVLVEMLGSLARTFGLRKILSPTVSEFNAVMLDSALEYLTSLSLPYSSCRLHRGLMGDGIEVGPGQAGIIAPADCPIVVVTAGSRTLMLHAGRDSLIDRNHIHGGQARKHESIIFSAHQYLTREERAVSKWHILPSISPGYFAHPFDDPIHGQSNEKLVVYLTRRYTSPVIQGRYYEGKIDLCTLIAAQLIEICGVEPDSITAEGGCTYEDIKNGDHTWHSVRRQAEAGQDTRTRNLVMVMRPTMNNGFNV